MEIKTERLILIPCTLKLVEEYAERGHSFGNHVLESIQHANGDPSQYGWGVWLAVIHHSGELIGDMGFKGKPDGNGLVDIGYGIVKEHQLKGYATEGAKSLIAWAFSTNRVQKVKADCLKNNRASIRVLQKLGMKYVGAQDHLMRWELQNENR